MHLLCTAFAGALQQLCDCGFLKSHGLKLTCLTRGWRMPSVDSWGMRTQDEREPGEDDRREQEADGAGAKLLNQKQDGDDGARQPDDERCKCMHRALDLWKHKPL